MPLTQDDEKFLEEVKALSLSDFQVMALQEAIEQAHTFAGIAMEALERCKCGAKYETLCDGCKAAHSKAAHCMRRAHALAYMKMEWNKANPDKQPNMIGEALSDEQKARLVHGTRTLQ